MYIKNLNGIMNYIPFIIIKKKQKSYQILNSTEWKANKKKKTVFGIGDLEMNG